MTDYRVFAAFAQLVVLALLFCSLRVRPSLGPLCAVGTTVCFFTLAGLLGVLPAAGWVFYALCFLALVWLLLRHTLQKKPLPRMGGGFWLFVAAGLFVCVAFLIKRPEYATWDEFSTWGISAKLAKLYDTLPSMAPAGWIWPNTQPPALALLSYFVQFFGPGFSAWQAYAAVDFLLFACVAALLSPFDPCALAAHAGGLGVNGLDGDADGKDKDDDGEDGNAPRPQWPVAFGLGVAAVLAPFVFQHTGAVVAMSPVYLDSLADIPMGFLFAAMLVAWYAAANSAAPLWARLLPVVLAAATLTLTKETGFVFALMAAALILADMLFAKRAPGVSRGKKALRLLAAFAALAAAVAGFFLLWHWHAGVVSGGISTEVSAAEGMGQLDMLLAAVRELFSPAKSEHFRSVMNQMGVAFFTQRAGLFGTGAMAALGFTAMGVLAAFLAGRPAQRRRCVVFTALAPLAFAAYYLFLSFLYIYVFTQEQTLTSYHRYLMTFFLGWFLAALALLAMSVAGAVAGRDNLGAASASAASGSDTARRRGVVAALAGKAAVLGIATVFCLLFWRNVPVAYSVFGFNAAAYANERAFLADAAGTAAALPENGKTFLISTGDNGLKWFQYHYAFQPRQMDYSYGGGEFLERTKLAGGFVEKRHIGPAEWRQYLIDEGVTTVLIDSADDAFRAEYGRLFSDGMAAYFSGETNLYNVEISGGKATLTPALGSTRQEDPA